MYRNLLLLFCICTALAASSLRIPLRSNSRIGAADEMPAKEVIEGDNFVKVRHTFPSVDVFPDTTLYKGAYFMGINGVHNSDVPGTPSLPATYDIFILPGEAENIRIEVNSGSSQELKYKPTPARTWDIAEDKVKETYVTVPQVAATYVAESTPVTIDYIGSKRNDIIVVTKVMPLLYDESMQHTKAYADIEYILHYDCPASSNGNAMHAAKITEVELPKNPNDSFPIYPPGIAGEIQRWNDRVASVSDVKKREQDDYLIIAPYKYYSKLYSFIEWKKRCGHDVIFPFNDEWTTQSIETAIREYYGANPYLKYVIFAGSIDEVPAKSVHTSYYGTVLSDYDYCCVWDRVNPSGNNTEYNRLRDLYSGRFFVSYQNDLDYITNKVINYERFGIDSESFYRTGFHVGHFQDGDPYTKPVFASDGIENNRYTMTSEEIRNYVTRHGMTINRLYGLWSYRSDPEYKYQHPRAWRNVVNRYGNSAEIVELPEDLKYGNYWYSYKTEHIANAFNNGALYCLELTHGSDSCWRAPEFTVNDIRKLKNGQKLPIVFNQGCSCGAYEPQFSFAKILLSHNMGGAVAAFAFSKDVKTHHSKSIAIGYFNTIWPYPGVQSTLNYSSGTQLYPNVDFLHSRTIPENRLALGSILEGGLLQSWKLFGNGIYNQYTNPNTSTDNPFDGKNKGEIISLSHITNLFGDPGMLFPTEPIQDLPLSSDNFSVEYSPLYNFNNNSRDIIITVQLPTEAKIGFYNKSTHTVTRFYGRTASYLASTIEDVEVSVIKSNYRPFFYSVTPQSHIPTAAPSKITSVSCDTGSQHADVSIENNSSSPMNVIIQDMDGNVVGNMEVQPTENTVSVPINRSKRGIHVVSLIGEQQIVDQQKLLINQ